MTSSSPRRSWPERLLLPPGERGPVITYWAQNVGLVAAHTVVWSLLTAGFIWNLTLRPDGIRIGLVIVAALLAVWNGTLWILSLRRRRAEKPENPRNSGG